MNTVDSNITNPKIKLCTDQYSKKLSVFEQQLSLIKTSDLLNKPAKNNNRHIFIPFKKFVSPKPTINNGVLKSGDEIKIRNNSTKYKPSPILSSHSDTDSTLIGSANSPNLKH